MHEKEMAEEIRKKDRDIAARDQRIKELEELLNRAAYSLDTYAHDFHGHDDPLAKSIHFMLADRDSN